MKIYHHRAYSNVDTFDGAKILSLSQFVIVSLNQLGMPATAGFMARLYLWQYGASMITITAWVALAMLLVY